MSRRLKPVPSEADVANALRQRVGLSGRWKAIHLRMSHDTLEAVPAEAAWGFPDWLLWAPRRGLLALELKGHNGRLTGPQRRRLRELALAGVEVGVVRPVDCLTSDRQPDPLYLRLVEDRLCPPVCPGGRPCTGWCRARQEAVA
jgi:hypothetical protein